MIDVYLNLITPKPLDNKADGEFLLRQLCKHSSLTPDKYGTSEPVRQPFDREHLNEITEKDWISFVFLWKRKKPRSQGTVFTRMGRGSKTGDVKLYSDSDQLKGEELSDLFQTAAGHFAATFGFLHLLTEPDIISGKASNAVASRAITESRG